MTTGIITFRSDRFDTSPLDDDLDPEQHPLGRDLALYLRDQLKSSPGVSEIDDDVDQEHDQWDFEFRLNGKPYLIAAHIVEESQPQSLWAVQLNERVGILRALFRSGDAFYEVDEAVIRIIKSILQHTPGVSDVQQLTLDQFRKVY